MKACVHTDTHLSEIAIFVVEVWLFVVNQQGLSCCCT